MNDRLARVVTVVAACVALVTTAPAFADGGSNVSRLEKQQAKLRKQLHQLEKSLEKLEKQTRHSRKNQPRRRGRGEHTDRHPHGVMLGGHRDRPAPHRRAQSGVPSRFGWTPPGPQLGHSFGWSTQKPPYCSCADHEAKSSGPGVWFDARAVIEWDKKKTHEKKSSKKKKARCKKCAPKHSEKRRAKLFGSGPGGWPRADGCCGGHGLPTQKRGKCEHDVLGSIEGGGQGQSHVLELHRHDGPHREATIEILSDHAPKNLLLGGVVDDPPSRSLRLMRPNVADGDTVLRVESRLHRGRAIGQVRPSAPGPPLRHSETESIDKKMVRRILGVKHENPVIFLDFGSDHALEHKVMDAIRAAVRQHRGGGTHGTPTSRPSSLRLHLIDPTTSIEIEPTVEPAVKVTEEALRKQKFVF